MILRDVVYAEKPRALQSATAASAPKSSAAVSIVSSLNTMNINPPAIAPQVEKLSIEKVMEWLHSQDDVVRHTVARSLDDEIEQLRDEAIIEGRAVGAHSGKTEFNSQCASALDALRALATNCEAIYLQQRDELTQKCAAIVGTALTRLVGAAMVRPEASLAAVKEAISQVCGARDVTIRVNNLDVEAVSAYRSEIAEILGSDELIVIADQRVSSGGCLLESSFGEIDARWETQLLALVNALRHDPDNNIGNKEASL